VRPAAIVSAAAFAGVAAAVQLGAFKALDQWAIDHVMPWTSPELHSSSTLLSSLLPFTSATPRSEIPAEVWLYPASVPVTALVTAGCCLYLWRSRQRLAALAWAGAWLLVDAIEVLGKETIRRPTPHLTREGYLIPMSTFNHSFPSGHALRALLLAALVVVLWPRVLSPATAWLAAALPLLVVTNAHAPSDVVGTVFLSLALALPCMKLSRREA
jgi:hypothetical protein